VLFGHGPGVPGATSGHPLLVSIRPCALAERVQRVPHVPGATSRSAVFALDNARLRSSGAHRIRASRRVALDRRWRVVRSRQLFG